MNKLYLVKREVIADNIEQAIKGKGKVYEISLANEEYQPKSSVNVGFKNANTTRKTKRSNKK